MIGQILDYRVPKPDANRKNLHGTPIVFYARVSTRDQKPDSQVAAARRLGVKDGHIFVEKASGARHDRPVLDKALAALEKGDTLACFKLDRLGRFAHLVSVIEDLDARGVHFMTAEDGLSTKGSTGKLVLNILGSIAQFERNLMLERTRAGLAAARAKGRVGGRRRKLGPAEVTRARQMLSKGELNADDVASMLKVSRRTLFRELRAARDREALSETAR
jgi:DNA invertase Pin-like site-specific DNA recombinase